MTPNDTTLSRRVARAMAVAAIATASLAPAAHAASADTYVRVHLFAGTTSEGRIIPVVGNDSLRAQADASLLVPGAWRRRRQAKIALRFVGGPPECRFRITLTERTIQTTDPTPADRLSSSMPHADASLQSGTRGSAAWRVILHKSSSSVSVIAERVQALRVTADNSIPAGQTMWHELRARAAEPARGECHSGSYRDIIGPQLGDVMATAHISAIAH